MTIYLDTLDPYYSPINYEPTEKPSKKNNYEKIGIISLILIVAFAIYIIWTIFDAYAYGVEVDNTKQYNLCLDTFKETYPNLDNDKETRELICGALWGRGWY